MNECRPLDPRLRLLLLSVETVKIFLAVSYLFTNREAIRGAICRLPAALPISVTCGL